MKEITMEQLLIGAILRFQKVDSLDLKILMQVLRENNIKIIKNLDTETEALNYLEVNGGVYSLRHDLSMDTEIEENYTIQNELENIAATDVLNVLFNMDIDLFTLRKVSVLSPKVKAIDALFNDREKESIANLKLKYMIGEAFSGPSEHDEELTLYVTKKGQVELFMNDNLEFMRQVSEIFKPLQFDINLLPMYLERKNLDSLNLNVASTFLTDFVSFCSEQDLSPYIPKEEMKR